MNYRKLMHGNTNVDLTRIEQGIFAAETPQLLPEDTTIIKLQNMIRQFIKIFGSEYYSVKSIENIDKCRIIEVSLTEKQN